MPIPDIQFYILPDGLEIVMGGRLDMQKGLIRKGLVFSVIILFISVSIQPVFADDVSISTTSDSEDCIECEVSDDGFALKVWFLVDFKCKNATLGAERIVLYNMKKAN